MNLFLTITLVIGGLIIGIIGTMIFIALSFAKGRR